MSLETEVASLTTATTNLLDAVNVSKATLDAKVTAASGSAATAATHAATSVAKATEAQASATSSQSSAALSAESAAQAAGAAASAAQIVFGNLIPHPNKINESLTIPDGYNAFLIDPVEIDPNITITGLGNSTLRGI